jgi:hypothetical protein
MILSRQTITIVLLLSMTLTASATGFTEEKLPQRESLGKNVTLHFSLAGREERFTVNTARKTYRLASQGNDSREHHDVSSANNSKDLAGQQQLFVDDSKSVMEQQEHVIELSGTVAFEPGTDMLFVTCMGSYHSQINQEHREGKEETIETEHITFEIDASALLKPGEEKILIRAGHHVLNITVDVEE